MPEADDRYRLPRTVVPRRYEITLEPDLEASTFSGTETVTVEVVEPVTEIVLNAADLQIDDARLAVTGRELAASVTVDAERERVTLRLPEAAAPGTHMLRIAFRGILNDKLAGFYRSTYRDPDGTERVIATTQMEATDARRAFPCWDEPDRKASFKITLVVDDRLLAISNGAVEAEEPAGPGKRRVRFTETMPMSTYLVAFVVGPLEATAPVDVDGVPLRVVHVPGKGHMATFALEVGAHALRFFTDYFGIPYPSDKLDLIALPDFAFGAMENLGAVTFRETALLVDPDTGSRLDRERVADVVAHEIAHMWFGDLVTMKWWNGIWLNEAFATFMELLCVDAFRPEWARWVSFSTGRAAAMVTDGTNATRPVEFPVRAPEEAEGMFDVLTYQKGASVVRMLEQYLGAAAFREGIRLYMERHQYANTETTDLWDAIEEATGEPVRSTMDSWIFQGGHPVVSVDVTADGTAVALRQSPFRYLDAGGASRWQVPILLRAGAAGEVEHRRVLLAGDSATVELPAKVDWVVVNAGGSGFYRTRYSPELLARLVGEPRAALDAIERFNLVNDTWAAVLAALTPATDFVELIRGFVEETDPDVWAAILGPLGLIERVVPSEHMPGFQAFVRGLAGPALQRVGWQRQPGEDERTGTLRATLVGALGGIGADPVVRERVAALHASYLRDPTSVDPDLYPAIVTVVSRTGGEAEYQQFLDRFRDPATPQEEVRFLYGLAGFQHGALLRRTLDLSVSGEVRTQNAPYLINAVLANPVGGPLAWEFVTARWEELTSRFPDNSHHRMLENVSWLFSTDLVDDVRSFLRQHPVKAGQLTVDQTLEKLAVNRAFLEREGTRLGAVFAG